MTYSNGTIKTIDGAGNVDDGDGLSLINIVYTSARECLINCPGGAPDLSKY